MREELQSNIKRLVDYLNFARSFFKRKNPFLLLISSLLSAFKEMLTLRQKLKMAKYINILVRMFTLNMIVFIKK